MIDIPITDFHYFIRGYYIISALNFIQFYFQLQNIIFIRNIYIFMQVLSEILANCSLKMTRGVLILKYCN